MKNIWRKFVHWWLPIAEAIGNFMNRLILSLFYFVIVLPFGLGVRLFSDPLSLRAHTKTGWKEMSPRSASVEEARKQF